MIDAPDYFKQAISSEMLLPLWIFYKKELMPFPTDDNDAEKKAGTVMLIFSNVGSWLKAHVPLLKLFSPYEESQPVYPSKIYCALCCQLCVFCSWAGVNPVWIINASLSEQYEYRWWKCWSSWLCDNWDWSSGMSDLAWKDSRWLFSPRSCLIGTWGLLLPSNMPETVIWDQNSHFCLGIAGYTKYYSQIFLVMF